VALDVPRLPDAEQLADRLGGTVGLLKVGLELFCAEGPRAVATLRSRSPVFLDLKLHDIPNTVESAARQAGRLGAAMLTVHASAGPAALEGAARGLAEGAREEGHAPPLLLAVTVLTSLDASAIAQIGLSGSPSEAALRLARLALGHGAGGLVCSPQEVALLRAELGPQPVLVVPGIRPSGATGDQARTGTAGAAIAAGADYLVVGRPIREAADPRAAAEAIVAEISSALRTTTLQ
jgi:orotidine-5'-phosphate decarboxylase